MLALIMRVGWWWVLCLQMEMLCLRDLIQRVLDPAGRAAEAQPRMREVLQHIDATPVRRRRCCHHC